MPTGERSDTDLVAPSRCAHVAARRRLPLIALAAACACACAIVPPALASRAPGSAPGATKWRDWSAHFKHGTGRHAAAAHARPRARGRAGKCARRASFHASGGKPRGKGRPRHAKRGAGCRPRRAGRRPHAQRHRRGSAKRGAPTGHAPASHSSSCPDADLRPTAEDLERIRAATLCLVNRERSGQGEVPLEGNGHLQQAAQGHSEAMVSGDYFEHTGQGGETPLQRMRAAGYLPSASVGYEVGENIAWGTLWLATPRAIVAAWMASAGHRANILDGHFHDTGVGVAPHGVPSLDHGQAGAIYTQDFGVILG
jgi:uncharacterized protein YkwD